MLSGIFRQPQWLGRASVPPSHTQNSLPHGFAMTSGLCGAPASRLPPAQPALGGCLLGAETSAGFRGACISRRRWFRSVRWGFRRQVRGAGCRGGHAAATLQLLPPPPPVPPSASRVAFSATSAPTMPIRLTGAHGRRCGR